MKGNKLKGFVVLFHDKGWSIALGADNILTDYHKTLDECIRSAKKLGYELFVEDME